MKVLLVNVTGKTGSTGKIVTDIRDSLLKEGHEAIIAYGHADKVTAPGYYKISKRIEGAISLRLSKLGRCSLKGNTLAFYRLKEIIKAENPDIVHLHCINCHCINVYDTLKYLASRRIKTVITHHAEFFYTGSCPYSYSCSLYSTSECKGCETPQYATGNLFFPNPHKNWKRMFEAVNAFSPDELIFTSVSPWVHERALKSPIVNRYKDVVVLNGLNTEIFKYQQGNRVVNRKFLEIKDYVLHVTPFFDPLDKNDIKGGYFVAELAKRLPQVPFVVISSVSQNCETLPQNVLLWGRTENQQELSQIYSGAQLTLLTSKRETFSMVTAESLCCGTPVIGFKAGGPESIAISKYSDFVDYGDVEILKNVLINNFNKVFDNKKISREASLIYSREKMTGDYITVYNCLLNNIVL
jgi:glycosyltransferase involved in cell wall biosynthesis